MASNSRKPRVAARTAAQASRAAALAASLGLQQLQDPDAASGLVLWVAADELSLADADRANLRPLCIDFGNADLLRRAAQAGRRGEALARAVGLHKRRDVDVIDATAGLGRDAFLLAAIGAEVLMLERDPVLACLLEDGLRRGRRCDQSVTRDACERLTLRRGDALEILPELEPSGGRYRVVYLDPMFIGGRGRAASGREMQILQALHGSDGSDSRLLHAALACPCDRVVVKRPAKAATVGDSKPSHVISGKSTRFDVYLGPLNENVAG